MTHRPTKSKQAPETLLPARGGRRERGPVLPSTNSSTPPPAPSSGAEPHPHGWVGYVVDDKTRTDNFMRLLRWLICGGIAALGVVALILWLLLQLPIAAAVVGGASAATGSATAWRRWRRRRARRGQPG